MTTHDFFPNAAVTGIGSLPFTDAEAAVRFVAEASPHIPFWPQLPKRSKREGMTGQCLGRLVQTLVPNAKQPFAYDVTENFLSQLDAADVALQPESAAGFFEFEKAFAAGAFPNAIAVKGQLTGAVTLASLLIQNGESLLHNRKRFERICHLLVRQAIWQVERLGKFNRPVLLLLDEPLWGVASETHVAMIKEMLTEIRAAGAMVGLHCCATLTNGSFMHRPQSLVAAGPDVISFDAHEHLELFCNDRAVQLFVERGGLVAFGLVPTLQDIPKPEMIFRRWQKATKPLGERCTTQSLVTATCGLGLLQEAAAQASFETARALSDLIRTRKGG
jgi:hypothetical protein